MRNTDEQLREIDRRAVELKRKTRSRRHLAAEALSVCACLCLIVLASVAMPRPSGTVERAVFGYAGSILLSSPRAGYVVIAVLAFLLGIAVTLLCMHLRGSGNGRDE